MHKKLILVKNTDADHAVEFFDFIDDLVGGFGIEIEKHICFFTLGFIDDVCDVDIVSGNNGSNSGDSSFHVSVHDRKPADGRTGCAYVGEINAVRDIPVFDVIDEFLRRHCRTVIFRFGGRSRCV